MKKVLLPYSAEQVRNITRSRAGESRVGDHVAAGGEKWQANLERSPTRYVIIGIAEDIGVRANLGRPGAQSAFAPSLSAFLNQQHNWFLDSSLVTVLGEINCGDLMKKAGKIAGSSNVALSRLRSLVAELDERVAAVIRQVAGFGKIPLVIGGGHNNAYGIIRGVSEHLGRALNVVSCDPHLDFRELEGRHSGNSFSYAFAGGFLDRYAVIGMHEQYNNQHALSEFSKHPGRLYSVSFESVFVRGEQTFSEALRDCAGFVGGATAGLEMDLDSITNMPSSARTSSGISALEARRFVHHFASKVDCAYFHVAEGAPVLSHIRADMKTGKFIAYLLSDFIKAHSARKALRDKDH